MQPIVVTAAILRRGDKVLIAQRRKEARHGLSWEFPGGKVEDGETPQEALERELEEELGVRTHTGHIYDARIFSYPDQKVLVLFYFAALAEGEPRPLDANRLAWVGRGEIMSYAFAGADADVARRLATEGWNEAEN